MRVGIGAFAGQGCCIVGLLEGKRLSLRYHRSASLFGPYSRSHAYSWQRVRRRAHRANVS